MAGLVGEKNFNNEEQESKNENKSEMADSADVKNLTQEEKGKDESISNEDVSVADVVSKKSIEVESTPQTNYNMTEARPLESEEGGGAKNTAETSTGNEDKEMAVDVYAYLKRQEFTTEIFKIEIQNLPRIFGYSQLKKRLQSLDLKPAKIKAFPNNTFAFVTFKCEEDRVAAIKAVTGHKWKGRTLKAKIAGPAADPMLRKRKQQTQEGEGPDEKKKIVDIADSNLTPAERVNNAVTPLWKVPYEEQLKSKQEEMREYLKRLGWDIGHDNPLDRDWLAEQRKKYEGMCCQFDEIIPSPVLNDYRNKCEFTIGKHIDGTDKAVGFRLGSYKSGALRVVGVEECIHINQAMKNVAKAFEMYLQTSPLTSFDPEEKIGHWRVLTVRTSATGAVLVIADFHPQSLTKEEITEEKDRLKEYFSAGAGKDSGISSLYCAIHSDRVASTNDEVPLHHILGHKVMEEKLLGMNFQISPLAFFQVNTQAAEMLYSRVKDWCKLTPQTTVFDVCCGTGTIGLSMAKDVEKVIGIELCLPAIENAKENSKINGIQNAEFHCGRAEHVLPPMIKRYSDKDVVAVVDPPRNGLHTDVVLAIRKSEFVKRLIYVSCNPRGAQLNMLTFTRAESRKAKGPPFRLTQAVPVDLFPHSKHCELVMLLER